MNLFIGNLNVETTVSKLRPLFAEFGEVVSAKIIMDNATGLSKGFGFVEMADKFHARDAIDNLDATYLDGNIISVKEAKQNNNSKGGGHGHGGGGNRSFRPRNQHAGGYNNDRGDRGSYSNNGGGYNNSNNGNGGGGYNNNRY
jgi:RNA recognition motif-containing protein